REEIINLAMPHLIKAGRLPENMSEEQRQWAEELIVLYQEQLTHGAEIVELTDLFFQTTLTYNEEAKEVLREEQVPEVLSAFLSEIEALEDFSPEAVKQATKAVQKKTGQKGKRLFMPIRVVTTGQTKGPELPVTISLLGKEKVISRLQAFLNEQK